MVRTSSRKRSLASQYLSYPEIVQSFYTKIVQKIPQWSENDLIGSTEGVPIIFRFRDRDFWALHQILY